MNHLSYRRLIAGLAALAGLAVAQPPPDAGQVKCVLRLQDGFFAVDEQRTEIDMRAFKNPAAARRALIADLNHVFRQMGSVCHQAFDLDTTQACPAEAAPIATFTGEWAAAKAKWQEWQMAQQGRPALATVFSDGAARVVLLGRSLPAKTGVMFEADPDSVVFDTGTLLMRLAPPVRRWSADAAACADCDRIELHQPGQGPPLRSAADVQRTLGRLTGQLWQSPNIQAAVEELYPADRVLRTFSDPSDPVFSVAADMAARTVRIREGVRIHSIEVAASVPGLAAQQAFYIVLPYEEFRQLGGARKKEYARGSRPLIGPEVIRWAAALQPLGLIIAQVIPVLGEDASVMVIGRANENEPEVPQLPGAIRLAGGFRYAPGQGFTLVPQVTGQHLGGAPQNLTASGGVSNAGVNSGFKYSRDFLLFSQLQRRLSAAVDTTTTLENKRLLRGVETNQRRWAATARGDLEIIPDRAGTLATAFFEADRTTIVLTRTGQPQNESIKIAGFTTGTVWTRRTPGLGPRRSFSLQPSLRVALPIAQSYARFTSGSALLDFVQELGSRAEVHSTFRGGQTSRGTPLIEQLSFGGSEMVRGYRRDEAIGRRSWSLQNELWFRLPVRSRSGLASWLARIRPAVFHDVGGVYQVNSGTAGARHGAGPGLRFQVAPGMFLKADYGYGFNVAEGRRRWRPYLGVGLGF